MTVYTVESGDSVYSIARKFGVPASRIVTDNELSNPSRLIVGQSIVILYPTETYTVRGEKRVYRRKPTSAEARN